MLRANFSLAVAETIRWTADLMLIRMLIARTCILCATAAKLLHALIFQCALLITKTIEREDEKMSNPHYRNNWKEETMCAQLVEVRQSFAGVKSCYRTATHAIVYTNGFAGKKICKMHESWIRRTNMIDGSRIGDWVSVVALENK